MRILAESAGRPSRFSVTFDRSVDDPTLAFLIWKNNALKALVPPRVGESVVQARGRGDGHVALPGSPAIA